MDKTQQVKRMTYVMTRLVDYMSKKLPDDVENKLRELAAQETNTLAKLLYETYFKNQDEALRLNRPSCQDTGLLQFFVRCGSEFPLILNLEGVLREAVKQATIEAPLRHNAVETFDEYNTGLNIGKDAPSVFWEIVSGDRCEIDAYMAGGGCTLPGHAMVINACPPLLVGVGVATSVETAALLSKKALMRPLGQHNPNERAAGLERLLEEGINRIGFGPQGMTGNASVLGVHVENSARHPSAIGVGVSTGCWSHRRAHIIFEKDLSYTVTSHKGAKFE